jgi:hypothetical protein
MRHQNYRENFVPDSPLSDNEMYIMFFLMFALGFACAVVVLT